MLAESGTHLLVLLLNSVPSKENVLLFLRGFQTHAVAQVDLLAKAS